MYEGHREVGACGWTCDRCKAIADRHEARKRREAAKRKRDRDDIRQWLEMWKRDRARAEANAR